MVALRFREWARSQPRAAVEGGEVSDNLESNAPWGETSVPTAEKRSRWPLAAEALEHNRFLTPLKIASLCFLRCQIAH